MEKIIKKHTRESSLWMKKCIQKYNPDNWKELWEFFAKDILHMDESEYKEIDQDIKNKKNFLIY